MGIKISNITDNTKNIIVVLFGELSLSYPGNLPNLNKTKSEAVSIRQEKLISQSRVTEVDAVSIRTIGAYKNTSLSSDAHLVKIFNALEPKSAILTVAINRWKADSKLEVIPFKYYFAPIMFMV